MIYDFLFTENSIDPNKIEPGTLVEDDIDVIITGGVQAFGTVKKRRTLKLSNDEIKIIISNDMLSDESINLAMNFLHRQFPNFDGFVDSSIGKCNGFEIIRPNKPYIQIFHVGSLHWICVANTLPNKMTNQNHFIYDSLCGKKLNRDTIEQISSYSFCSNDELSMNIMPVQQQRNGTDCGLFAIAFATSLAYGDDPTELLYDDNQLCRHLLYCLKKENMERFPSKPPKTRAIRCKKQVDAVELFCSCRKPWKEGEVDNRFDMAQCFTCAEWFHRLCERIPARIFNKEKSVWNCNSCAPK